MADLSELIHEPEGHSVTGAHRCKHCRLPLHLASAGAAPLLCADRVREALRVARIAGIRAERERIIGCIEETIGQRISDGGQYRADIRSALLAWWSCPSRDPWASGRWRRR